MNGGKLKTLVVMADERMKTMPDVPTLKEKGVDLHRHRRGLIVSQKTPQDVVDVLAKAAKRRLKSLHSRCTAKVESQLCMA